MISLLYSWSVLQNALRVLRLFVLAVEYCLEEYTHVDVVSIISQ